MTIASDRRRTSKVARRSRTVHVSEQVWDEIDDLVNDGVYASLSQATEEALKLLLSSRPHDLSVLGGRNVPTP